MKNIILKLSILWSLFWRSSVIASYPFVVAIQQAKASGTEIRGIELFAFTYQNELLVFANIILLMLGSVIGYFYREPDYGGKALPKPAKFLVSLTGGFIAFLYVLDKDKQLSLLMPVWVAATSFMAPALIHLFHALAIKVFGIKFGLTNSDLEQWRSGKLPESKKDDSGNP